MKITATVTTSREVERDIELPFFAKDKYSSKFYRINEDQSVLSVSIIKGYKENAIVYANMELETNVKSYTDVIAQTPCTPEEFEDAICAVIEYMDDKVSKFQNV